MSRPSPILLVVDALRGASAVTGAAIELARKTRRPLHVVASWWVEPRTFGAIPVHDPARLAAERRAVAVAAADEAVRAVEAAGLPSCARVLEGPAMLVISQTVKELQAGTVVVRRRECGRFARLVEAPFAERLARRCGCPVLAVDPAGTRTAIAPAA